MLGNRTRSLRALFAVLAIAAAACATVRPAAAAGGHADGAPALSAIPSEPAIAASANPNLTPLLFSVDPSESAVVYARMQAYGAENATSCGGDLSASQGGCCPITPSDGACDDHDPSVVGCGDASSYTVTQANITDALGNVVGLVETRFSPTCDTNWARVTGFGAYAAAVKQSTVCRGTQGQYSDSGCSDTDTGTESTRFSDQLYAPTECAMAVGVLVLPSTGGLPAELTAATPPAC